MKTLKNQFHPLLLFVFVSLLLFSCHKEVSNIDSNGFTLPDFETKVSSSVSGFVTDENNAPVMGTAVSAGNGTATTDKYGYFEIKNVQVVKSAAVVTVNKPGYFKGIKTYIAQEGKSVFFRIKMIPKSIAGTINASTGGNVTLTNGLVIALPANGVVNAATNTTYSGTVSVASHWLNPTASDLNQEMPGDQRGIATDGSLKTLTTYGIAAVELTGSSGELLQIAAGKKATLTISLPTATLSTAPSSIPLWYFDEAIGLWKEEGVAIKTGNAYIGEVSHFSYWNCNLPNAIVPLNFTVIDVAGNPIGNEYLEIRPLNPTSFGHIAGLTNLTGYVSVFVTPNTQYSLSLKNHCTGNIIYSQTFTVGTTSVSLGNIVVPASNTANITGTVTDCNNNPVTNGYVILQIGYQYLFGQSLSNTGSFNFSTVLCSNATNVNIIAVDLSTNQQSLVLPYTLTNGTNAVGNLQACGNTVQEFMNYSVDGINYSITMPNDSISMSGTPASICYIVGSAIGGGTNNSANLSFSPQGIGLNSLQPLSNFLATNLPSSYIQNPLTVTITEFGAVGQFISGNFSGIFTNQLLPNTTYNVACNFRVRRTF